MFSRAFAAAAAVLLSGGAVFAQSQATPAFEVATIKPSPPMNPASLMSGQMHVGMTVDGSRVDIGFFPLQALICTAYKIKPYQLEGPDWLKDQRWDILAKMPEGANKDQVPEMLQQLLADRFHLKILRGSSEHSVYALTVAKSGLKMKEAEPDPAPAPGSTPAEGAPAEPPPAKGEIVMGRGENQIRVTRSAGGRGATVSNAKFGQMKIAPGENGTMVLQFSKMKMSDLADMLTPFLDHPVVDQTDLKGSYQVGLELTMEEMMRVARMSGMMGAMGGPAAPGAPAADASHPADAASNPSSSLFAAIQKLGLKLENRKLPVDTITVVHVEKTPTEN